MRFDGVARLIQRVIDPAGVEIAVAFSRAGIKLKTGIGPLRHAENFVHLALHVHEFVQLHFLPILHAHIGRVGVHRTKGNARIAHGLQEQALHRFSVRMQNFNLRINRRTASRRICFDHQNLTSLCIELKQDQRQWLSLFSRCDSSANRAGNFQSCSLRNGESFGSDSTNSAPSVTRTLSVLRERNFSRSSGTFISPAFSALNFTRLFAGRL